MVLEGILLCETFRFNRGVIPPDIIRGRIIAAAYVANAVLLTRFTAGDGWGGWRSSFFLVSVLTRPV